MEVSQLLAQPIISRYRDTYKNAQPQLTDQLVITCRIFLVRELQCNAMRQKVLCLFTLLLLYFNIQ